MRDSRYIEYLQHWTNDTLPFDDIQIQDKFFNDLHNDQELDIMALGSTLKNRHIEPSWKDLDLQKFLHDNHSANLGIEDNCGNNDNDNDNIRGLSEMNERNTRDEFSNDTGGIHAMSHDRTIVDTIRFSTAASTPIYTTAFSRTNASEDFTGLSLNSPESTQTTTASLSRNTNRLTVADSSEDITSNNTVNNRIIVESRERGATDVSKSSDILNTP